MKKEKQIRDERPFRNLIGQKIIDIRNPSKSDSMILVFEDGTELLFRQHPKSDYPIPAFWQESNNNARQRMLRNLPFKEKLKEFLEDVWCALTI